MIVKAFSINLTLLLALLTLPFTAQAELSKQQQIDMHQTIILDALKAEKVDCTSLKEHSTQLEKLTNKFPNLIYYYRAKCYSEANQIKNSYSDLNKYFSNNPKNDDVYKKALVLYSNVDKQYQNLLQKEEQARLDKIQREKEEKLAQEKKLAEQKRKTEEAQKTRTKLVNYLCNKKIYASFNGRHADMYVSNIDRERKSYYTLDFVCNGSGATIFTSSTTKTSKAWKEDKRPFCVGECPGKYKYYEKDVIGQKFTKCNVSDVLNNLKFYMSEGSGSSSDDFFMTIESKSEISCSSKYDTLELNHGQKTFFDKEQISKYSDKKHGDTLNTRYILQRMPIKKNEYYELSDMLKAVQHEQTPILPVMNFKVDAGKNGELSKKHENASSRNLIYGSKVGN